MLTLVGGGRRGDRSDERSIVDDNNEFVPPDLMIEELLGDNRRMAERQRAAIAVCEDNRDSPTGNILQEILDETEKRVWFLYEIGTGGKNQY